MVTRFAPSLTGYLHLGHVLHMIYVWGIAQSKGAKVICRIEDHDQGRARPEYETAILENMEWLGFIPDRGIRAGPADLSSDYRQSNCDDHYASVLEVLYDQGLVYGCECSRKQIMATQVGGEEELCYAGTCSSKGLSLEGNTVRLCVPDGVVEFQDLRLGKNRQTPVEQCGDFALRDRTGQWSYQFCCVCDDIRQRVDLVIRGEDILSSTARQIQFFQMLGSPAPRYYHHPLLCDEQGRKLSKRQRSESISQLRDRGKAPEEILGDALFSGGLMAQHHPVDLSQALSLVV